MLFGNDALGELFHTRNGLLLSTGVEKRFDKHQLVIVPANGTKLQEDGTIDRWVLKIVEDSIKGIFVADINGTFADLHDRELVFRTSARPAARYLYFHYLVAMLRAKKHGRKLYQKTETNGMQSIESDRPDPWGTFGPYLKERMVRALIAETGHDVFKDRELEKFTIPDNRAPGIEERAIAAHLVGERKLVEELEEEEGGEAEMCDE